MPVGYERLYQPRKPRASVENNGMIDAVEAAEKKKSMEQWTYIACNEHVVGLAREAAGYSLADFVH